MQITIIDIYGKKIFLFFTLNVIRGGTWKLFVDERRLSPEVCNMST